MADVEGAGGGEAGKVAAQQAAQAAAKRAAEQAATQKASAQMAGALKTNLPTPHVESSAAIKGAKGGSSFEAGKLPPGKTPGAPAPTEVAKDPAKAAAAKPEAKPGMKVEKPEQEEPTPTTQQTIAKELEARKPEAGSEDPAKKAGRIDQTGATNIIENHMEQPDAAKPAGREAIQNLLNDPKVKFDGQAREGLQNYLNGGAKLPGGEGQPPSGYISSATHYGQGVSGPSAAKTPSPADVRQGDAGDCYFAATMASLAQANPQAIQNAIKDKPDGTYDVTLYKPGADGKPEAQTINVDGKLPLDANGKPSYMQPVNGQNWAPIMEKAFAQMNGGYGKIGAGGSSADAMYALTGKQGTTEKLDPSMTPQDRNAQFENLRSAFNAGQMTTVGTTSDTTKLTGRYDAGHQYTVTGVGGEGANRYVDVMNPYGMNNAQGDFRSGVEAYKPGRTTATVRVPFDKFFTRFDEIVTGPSK